MANKKRRQQQRNRPRPAATPQGSRPAATPQGSRPEATGESEAGAGLAGARADLLTAPAASRPATQRPATQRPATQAITAPRRPQATAAGASIDIDARVPHFASDLRRIAITAAVMILVIIAASFVIK